MPREAESAPGRFLARLSTSNKLLAILTVALLPLGLIALLASLQTVRTADAQRRADVGVAANEASRKLGTELTSDIVVLAQAVNSTLANPTDADVCVRPAAVFAARPGRLLRFAVYAAQPEPLCATPGPALARPAIPTGNARPSARIVDDELEMIVPAQGGSAVAVARYPVATLAAFSRPTGFNVPYRLQLDDMAVTLPLVTHSPTRFLRSETATTPVGISDLSVTMTAESASFGAAEALLTFLPLLMWASAAIVGFYVVDRVLVKPLTRLRADVGSYVPGTAIRLDRTATPSVEIGELRHSFADFADRLAARERDVEAALADQIRLTREVHHRVKNNLQVISSLISLHARGATSSETSAAYATIQRRVDALAIVHRNHFAELETSRGIDVRALLGELSVNFRANAAPGAAAPAISVAAAPLLVTQDIAMPLAFLFTELAELSMLADPAAGITVTASAEDQVARLTMISTALRGSAPTGGSSAYAMRIVEGLARQLRAPLDHDADAGRYAIVFPLMAEPEPANAGHGK